MTSDRLRIVHCFRSPVGGVFRHVRDLIEAQIAEGHDVGILCDSITGGAFEEALIAEIAPKAALGVHRVTMRRSIAPSDLLDLVHTHSLLKGLRPDILHGHGAKGGAYVRIVGTLIRAFGQPCARLYTPHGGSMHYDPKRLRGRLFFHLEAFLERLTDHFLFVSDYERKAYFDKVGVPKTPFRVVHNGLSPAEFVPVEPDADAADFLYVGMLRALKGPDIFLDALSLMKDADGRQPSAVIVGAGVGEERADLVRQAERLMPGRVTFHDPMPARAAFRLGRVLVLPSRADSLPYVLMEALAAGLPVAAVEVGGVREILPERLQALARPNDPASLAAAMADAADGRRDAEATTAHLRLGFSIERMGEETMQAYRRALQAARLPRKRRSKQGTFAAETLRKIEPPGSKES